MATKSISSSYPSGYALSPAYQTLAISASSYAGSAGVTTVVTQPSTIDNLGKVQDTAAATPIAPLHG